MFTGIIEYVGVLAKKEGALFTFKAPSTACKKLHQGTSIAINGVCLTVFKKSSDTFSVEMIPETISRTMLGTLQKDDLVNLELPLTTKDLLSGHIIQGHIDGVGKVMNIKKDQHGKILQVSSPKNLSRYMVAKGSIAINGISLTIMSVKRAKFTVGIIPHTFEHTMMHQLKTDDLVNIEVDILAKYVEKLLWTN